LTIDSSGPKTNNADLAAGVFTIFNDESERECRECRECRHGGASGGED